ncbi:eukaryotic peptide chain release factor subunit 1 [Gregarina niphandrodes]|uniref:Eukaryotic peptide chain release factor subunit 1 n=1 Tax=Gregarina niphandrodes TaxID=110365 RepID=A0A023BAB4_GRENI|nr:eukaryotic peptide chain release factor subunit 1 [Gregarina niphandrodes]EZG78160.1 eukaryotic peptide chain release factor subunit 1 [Gregarina niphandrodes]|eukprot:XP_011129446.1 eukaryotic peptide chain release factor subunit 1 [Gregarina niphandrodes]
MSSNADDENVEQWKIKRLIKQLGQSRGSGTSMISLVIKPKDDISRINRMLTEEYGTASNIKNRVNRLSVLSAISSTQQKLKKYNRTPPNGLVIYCGTVLTEDGKEKKVNTDFEPFKPVNTSLYLCDSKFHVEPLMELLESNDRFGFIVMDGSGSLFAAVQGNNREVLHKFSVDLPKKHRRGGQSSVRFARLRTERRHNYVRRVGEIATTLFITNDKPNVTGLILAGSADFKTELAQSDLLDPRLALKVIKIVDIAYGGENGLNQAIEISQDTLSNVKLVHEKKIICQFFDEVATDSGKYIYGIHDTIKALEMGCVEILIVWENLTTERLVVQDTISNEQKILYIDADPTGRTTIADKLKEHESQGDLEVVERMLLAEWLVQNYQNFGAEMEFVTTASQEGSQFQKGFGGLGGILRYKVDFAEMEPEYADDSDDDFM